MTYQELIDNLRTAATTANPTGTSFLGTLAEFSKMTSQLNHKNALIHFAPPSQTADTDNGSGNWEIIIAFTERDNPGNVAQTADQNINWNSREQIVDNMFDMLNLFIQTLSNSITEQVQKGTFTADFQTYSEIRSGVSGTITIINGVDRIC